MQPEYLSDLDAEGVEEVEHASPEGKGPRKSRDDWWFPEDHDETAQEIMQSYLYGNRWITFRHLVRPSEDPQAGFQRRHSIDLPHSDHQQRYHKDLSAMPNP